MPLSAPGRDISVNSQKIARGTSPRDTRHSQTQNTSGKVCLHMYKIFLTLETGEVLELTRKDRLNEAKQLLESFSEHWPGDYSIQDAESDADIDLED